MILVVIQFSLSGCIPIGIKGQSRLAMVSIDAHAVRPSPVSPVATTDR